jgi:hypothetical protein
MSIFDQPVTSDMGCSLIEICSISVLFLPNCIVKPFISFTPSVSAPLMNTITGCVPYLARYPMAMQGVSVNLKVPVKMLFIV